VRHIAGCGVSPRPVIAIAAATLLPIGRSAAGHDTFDFRGLGFINTNGHKRTAALDAFGIDLGFIVAHARACQRPNKPARSSAYAGTGKRGDKPSRRHDRAYAGYRQRANASQQSSATPKHGTKYGTRPCPCAGVSASTGAGRRIGTRRRSTRAPVRIGVCHKTDFAVRNASSLQIIYNRLGVVIAVVHPRNGTLYH
jgi:hypothetical protein